MPAIVPRHSASFTNPKVRRFISKNDLNFHFFLQDYQKIERELTNKVTNKSIEADFEKFRDRLKKIYSDVEDLSFKVESSLKLKAQSYFYKSLFNLNDMQKKIIATEKKLNSELFDNARKISNLLYPFSSLQERIYSPLNFISIGGIDYLNEKIESMTIDKPDGHYIIDL